MGWDCAACPGLASPGSSSSRELTFLETTSERPRAQVKQMLVHSRSGNPHQHLIKSRSSWENERGFCEILSGVSIVYTVGYLPTFVGELAKGPAVDISMLPNVQ